MKNIKIIYHYNWLKIIFVLLAISLTVVLSASAYTLQQGSPFTAPDDNIKMEEGWHKLPIKYKDQVGKADIVITLDQHLYSALLPIIRDYEKKQGITIYVTEGTCGITSGKLFRKEVDIGGYCCPPAKTDRLPGLRYYTLGVAALGLLVNSSNPIDNVTLMQARKIFGGEILNWSELKDSRGNSGPSLSIQSVVRLHCKQRPGHWKLLLANEDLFSPDTYEVAYIPDMISAVAENQKAIGFEVLWYPHRYRKQKEIKALKINDYSPYNHEDIVSGGYPLYRVLNITTWIEEGLYKSGAQRLVEFLLQHTANFAPDYGIVSASDLRKAKWKFKDEELVGEPETLNK